MALGFPSSNPLRSATVRSDKGESSGEPSTKKRKVSQTAENTLLKRPEYRAMNEKFVAKGELPPMELIESYRVKYRQATI